MLDKQTAIELAEALGYRMYDPERPFIIIDGEKRLLTERVLTEDYFTFERMALLALEYKIRIKYQKEHILASYDNDERRIEAKVSHYAGFEDRKIAYCMAVAKVLIEIKRSGE